MPNSHADLRRASGLASRRTGLPSGRPGL